MLDRPRWPRWRRRVTASAVLLLAAGIAALAVWQVLAVQARDAVVVGADARPFICSTGSSVNTSEEDDPLDVGDRYTSAVVLTKGLDCDLRFVVVNTGSLPVRVRAVQLPLLGPGSTLPVHATELDGGFFLAKARATDDRHDAGFVVPDGGMLVPAGDDVVLFARLRWKDDGCVSPGGIESTGDSPAVTVSVLGTESVRTPELASWAYLGKDRASCHR